MYAAFHLNLLLLVVQKWMKSSHLLLIAIHWHLPSVDFVFNSLVTRLRGKTLVNHVKHIKTDFS